MKSISWRTQLWLIALGYVAALLLAAGLAIPRYLFELRHHEEVSAAGGMYAGGDMLLAIFIVCLFMVPTGFLVWVTAKFEASYNVYSQVLLGFSLSAPVCLGLLFLAENYLAQNLDSLLWYRLFWSPLVLLVMGISRFAARFARAKRLITYALLTEGLTLAVGIGLIIFGAFPQQLTLGINAKHGRLFRRLRSAGVPN